MNVMDLIHNSGVADKAQGVVIGSAAVQLISNYATEITLGITLLSFLVMWYYKHKTNKRDEEYKKELLKIKKGDYSRLLIEELERNPNITPPQLTILRDNLEKTLK